MALEARARRRGANGSLQDLRRRRDRALRRARRQDRRGDRRATSVARLPPHDVRSPLSTSKSSPPTLLAASQAESEVYQSRPRAPGAPSDKVPQFCRAFARVLPQPQYSYKNEPSANSTNWYIQGSNASFGDEA